MTWLEALLADVRGFMKSRVILTAAELDFFTSLDRKPATARELAASGRLDERVTTRVLDCLVTFGLMEKTEEVYRLTESGAPFSADHPRSILPMVLHANHLWINWSQLSDITRNGPQPGRGISAMGDEEASRAFIGAMHVVGRALSVEIAASCDLARFRRLLDIGGASGSYTISFLSKNPDMTAVLFDLPGVVPLAEERLREAGILERVQLVAGDFYTDELPTGCDLALLSAIIHQNSPAQNLELYRKIHRALDPGGTLLIRDHIMDESRTHPPAGVMFAINMVVNTGGGDTYTFQEVKEELEQAGFIEVRQTRTGPKMDCLVEAKKPL